MTTFSRITALLVSISLWLWGFLFYQHITNGHGLLSLKQPMPPRRFLLPLLIAFSMFSLALAGQGADAQLLEYLKREALSPEQYVVQSFKKHDVVLLGERHIVKENLLLLQRLVPELHQNGIYQIGMEFGASEVQEQLDRLVTAPVYDEALARELMFAYNPTWGFQEYLDVYKAAWALNRSLPKGARRFRILNLSYQFKWERFDGKRNRETMKAVFDRGTADQFRARLIEKEILQKKEKLLALVGGPHAYTRYATPYFKYNGDDFCAFDNDWLGNRLYRKYPKKVFSVLLHQAFPHMEKDSFYMGSPAGGAIERLMAANGNRPVGFDLLGSPIGKLPDRSAHSLCYESFVLEQFFDGYLFLEPLRDLEGCTVVDDFVNESNVAHALKNFPDPDWHREVKTLEDLRQFIRQLSKDVSLEYSRL